jgi:hypothetical protein
VFWYAEGLYDDLPTLLSTWFQQPAAFPLQPVNWRPPSTEREETAATTVATAGFPLVALAAASGGQARLAGSSALASDQVTYTLPVAEAGLWSVIAQVPSTFGLTNLAPFTIAHVGGTAVVGVDQSHLTRPGWREIGTFWLAAGQTTVTIGARPGQSVVADAVGLMRSRLPSGPFSTLGVGTPGTLGGVRISMHGRAGIGGRMIVQANRLAPATGVIIGLALQGTSIPLFGGTLYVLPVSVPGGFADALGTFTTNVDVPWSSALVGTQLFAQALAFDPLGIDGVTLSAGASATIQ